MPPKARFTREKIEQTAYQIAREKGIQAVAAREVAKEMGMTVTPIFSYFAGMEELKETVRDRVRAEFLGSLQGALEYSPAFEEFGLRWMRYASENPNLYRLLIESGEGVHSVEDLLGLFRDIVDPMSREIADTFAISQKSAGEILRQMMIYINGLSGFLLQPGCSMTEEELTGACGEVCLALAVRAKLQDGSADIHCARELLSRGNVWPRRKHQNI